MFISLSIPKRCKRCSRDERRSIVCHLLNCFIIMEARGSLFYHLLRFAPRYSYIESERVSFLAIEPVELL